MVSPASKRNDHLSQYDTDYLRFYHWSEYKRAVISVFFLFPFGLGRSIFAEGVTYFVRGWDL